MKIAGKYLATIAAAACIAITAVTSAAPSGADSGSGEWVTVKEGDYCSKQTTRLILAAEKGDTATVERLIAGGADVNAHEMREDYGPEGKEKFPGKTALMRAAEKGYATIVEKLLAAGVDVNAKSRFSACGNNLYGKGEGESALVLATGSGHIKIAECLLAAGANVNDGGYGGCVPETDDCSLSPTPLGLALEQGRSDMIDLLLQHKANPNLGLCAAAAKGRTEMVKLLLDKGANVNHNPEDGVNTSPLTCAVLGTEIYEQGCRGHAETVKLLLSRGANPNDKYEMYPGEDPASEPPSVSVLQYARERRCTQIVKLLQSAGAGKSKKR